MREPVIFQLPVTKPEPVKMRVSIAENVELPETVSEPLTIAPVDAVIDANSALLPLTITLFQVANYYSILLHRVHISILINMNLSVFW